MRRFLFLILTCLAVFSAKAQIGTQKNNQQFYVFETIYDSAAGINIYEKLNKLMGGDSMRYTAKGYSAQNWWEDYYKSGKLLHRGFYVEGQLRIYKNFYENGQVERDFHTIDYFRYQMILYYPDGKVRSDITYYDGEPETTNEYYPNGQLEFSEEMAKKNEYLITRKFFFENGSPQSSMELLDKKKKVYAVKEYFENGFLQNEGAMKYYAEIDNYMKEGIWNVYDDKGKQISTEEYVHGQLIEEKKVN
jgi:antitoxin component YwqK of YwqJK toxin-antitoxin module